MGWGSLLGDLAKDFAQDYVRERGIKGAFEDIKDAASGLFGSSDSGNAGDGDWDAFTNCIKELIDQNEYSEALSTVDNYYNEYMEGEPDVNYYYLRSWILLEYLEMSVGDAEFEEIHHHFVEALKEAQGYKLKDIRDDLNELNKRSIEAVETHKELVAWSEMCGKCDEFCNKAQFDKAEKLIDDWYSRQEKDVWWPYKRAKINFARHNFDLSQGRIPSDSEIKDTEAMIAMVARYDDSAEECKELSDELQNIKTRCSLIKGSAPAEAVPAKKSISDSEQEYLEELKACLADDGEISARERKLLNKLSRSLGISEKRAAELEALASGNAPLTDSEKEYLEEYKACIENDGVISERERRLLDRLAKSLSISPERAAEIEKMKK